MSIKKIIKIISLFFLSTNSHAYNYLVDSSVIELPKIDLALVKNNHNKYEILILLQKFNLATSNEERIAIIDELSDYYYEELEILATFPTAQCSMD